MDNTHIPEKFGLPAQALRLPPMTVLWVSNVCNAQCGHCPFHLDQSLRQQDNSAFMSFEVYQKIIDDLSGEPDRVVRLTGTGEPLLNKDIEKFIVYGKSKGVQIGLITNGSLLNDKNIETFLGNDIDIIEISVDASDEETYARIREGLSFTKLVDNVQKLLKRREQLATKTSIIVSIINQPDKLKNLDETVRYWEKLVDKVLVRKWITWNVLDDSNFTEPFLDQTNRVPCPWPFDRVHIASNGDVLFCADDLKRDHIFGNVLKDSLHDIWRGEKFEQYRQYHLNSEYDKIDICKTCKDWPYKSWNYNYLKTVNELKQGEHERKFIKFHNLSEM